LLTGFSSDAQESLESLEFENQKKLAQEEESLSHFFEKQRRVLESVVKELSTPEFVKIGATIDRLKQLSDICKYIILRRSGCFDTILTAATVPMSRAYQPVPPEILETPFMDLYYVTADMNISTSLAKAFVGHT